MIAKATYESEADIPADYKHLFHLVDGKWIFNYSEFEGLAELSNPSLNTAKEDILRNKKAAENERDEWKRKSVTAETEVANLKKPGTVIITKEENDSFEGYKKLGTVKDLTSKIETGQQSTDKLQKFETEKEIRSLAKQTGVSEEALVDFVLNTSYGSGIKVGKEKRKVKEGKNDVEKEILVIIHEDEVNGEKKTRNQLFSEYATEKSLPEYLVKGITNNVSQEPVEKNKRFQLPDTSRRKSEDGNNESQSVARNVIKANNDARNNRQLPWMKTAAKKEE